MTAAARAPVVVVGTVFVDIKCFPQYEINYKGRNPGRARFYHGGVGRNVAETMALLGSRVRFSSAVQDGGIGHEVMKRLDEAGVDVDGMLTTADPEGMGMWVAILHRDGDLACSISQMPNTAYLEEAWARFGKRLLTGAGLCVLELDLSVALAEQVLADARAAGVRVVGLPGNSECIRKKPELLSGLSTYICNQVEAEELWGRPVTSIPAAQHAALAILERGPSQVVVTLGALGCEVAERGMGEPVHVPALPVEVVDTTGAGDAFVAGVSHALACGADLRLAAEAGARVAAWTVSQSESVCLDIPERKRRDLWPGWRVL
ncbi:MAG: carbohydrate kinase family protein [Bacillota bacterium]